MPMMIVCDKLAYVPGRLITGHVVIVSKSPQKVKGLTMRFIGRSSKLMGEVEGTKRYKKEVYFDEKVDIFGHDGSNTQLRVGETLYPFTFPLPHGLPSSFEWSEGNVLYFAEAKLTRASWKDKRVSTRIQVDGVYDLNLEPSVLTPMEAKKQKYVQHLLTKSGPYGFLLKCNRSGFVRGHSLPFSVEIKNLSKVDSRKLRVSLLQEVKLEGGKSFATLVEQMKGPAVTAGEVVTWEARLKVPAGVPPSNLGNVLSYPAVIKVSYFLHIQMSLKNCREEPICIKMPITIGTISYNRRALSVPSLEDSAYLPYCSNGHRVDCPMSQQVILPSAALSTSQFSPHLVTPTSFTHHQTQVTRGQSLLSNTLSPRNAAVHVFGPVRQYEYYFEYEDAQGMTRSVTSRGDSLFHRRRNQTSSTGRRRYFVSATTTSESPPPSYDEIFTREQGLAAAEQTASGSMGTANVNETSSLSTGVKEAIQKTLLSTQLSSSSSVSSEEVEEAVGQSLLLSLSSPINGTMAEESSSGSDENTDDEEEDEEEEEDACSTVSANDEFLSCSGSSGSSFEEFTKKCHELQNSSEQKLCAVHHKPSSSSRGAHNHENYRPCPSGNVCNGNRFQGGCDVLCARLNTQDDKCRNANNNTSSSDECDSSVV